MHTISVFAWESKWLTSLTWRKKLQWLNLPHPPLPTIHTINHHVHPIMFASLGKLMSEKLHLRWNSFTSLWKMLHLHFLLSYFHVNGSQIAYITSVSIPLQRSRYGKTSSLERHCTLYDIILSYDEFFIYLFLLLFTSLLLLCHNHLAFMKRIWHCKHKKLFSSVPVVNHLM